MWNKKADESPRGQAEEPAVRENIAPPRRDPAPPPPRAAACVIGSTMRIKGDISSREEIYIDGEVEGSLALEHSLTVGPHGKVRANIKAKDLTIVGKVQGNVDVAGRLAIREQGSLVGDVRTAGISIDDGAYFKGGIDIVRSEPTRNGKPVSVSEPSASAAAQKSA